MTEEQRVWQGVDRSGGADACWPSRDRLNKRGTRQFHDIFGLHTITLHRAVFFVVFGPVEPKQHVHLICGSANCGNPAHMTLNRKEALQLRTRGEQHS